MPALPSAPRGFKWEFDPRPGRRPVLREVGRGRRGKPPRADDDGLQLRLAQRELAAGADAYLEALRMPRGLKADRCARAGAIRTALAKLALATRLVDELVIRRGGIAGDVIDDE